MAMIPASLLKLGACAGEKILALLRGLICGDGEDGMALRREQARLNAAEIEGAPQSRLRLWRSFLGWVLSAAFAWEMLRPVILWCAPGADLPPSMLKDVTAMLSGLLGLGG